VFSFLLHFFLGWVAGTALQLQQASLWLAEINLVACSASGFLLLVWLLCQHRLRLPVMSQCVLVLLLSTTCAFFSCAVRAQLFLEKQIAPQLEGQILQVVGRVVAMPQQMQANIRFRFAVQSVHFASGESVELPPLVLLGWYVNTADATPSPADVQAGDIWKFSIKLKAPHGHINPHGFDYELWLWEQDLQATGYVRRGVHDAPPRLIARSWAHPIERLRQWVRQRIYAQVGEQAGVGVVLALLLGDQASIERADWDVFRATGVAHLMAISGLHITALAWLVARCVAWLWRRSDLWSEVSWCMGVPSQKVAMLAALVTAVGYSIFTGWAIPAQRTVWMLGAVLTLRMNGLKWPAYQVLLFAATVVLVADPWAFLQAGFWLSFMAVSILFVGSQSFQFLPALIREQFLMSVCMAPLSLLFFHQVSLVGFFANLVAVPWVTCVVTPLCMLGLLAPVAWSLAAWAVGVQGLCLGWMASLSWAQWSAPAAPLWLSVLSIAGMFVCAMPIAWLWRLSGALCILPVLSWHVPRPPVGEFELIGADMGQGHAVLVRTAHQSLLYDTGPRYSPETDAGQRVLVPLLMVLGERLNRVIISHQDSDHSGGAHSVLKMQSQAQVLTSMPSDHFLRAMHPMQPCEAGQHWRWDGVLFSVMHPQKADYAEKNKPNAMSCVLRIQSASGVSALLVADIEAAQEKQLLESGVPLKSDWLLVPHHGSATSSTTGFLQAVSPSVAWVQAGYRNRFGHPRPEVMARYAAQGIQVFQSVWCGASIWQSHRPQLMRCARDEYRRYWHHLPPIESVYGSNKN
jgi:competence protein ComEC